MKKAEVNGADSAEFVARALGIISDMEMASSSDPSDRDWKNERERVKYYLDEFKLQTERGLYVQKEPVMFAVESGVGKIVDDVRRVFESELPPKCEGLSANEIRTICAVAIDALVESWGQHEWVVQ